MNLRTKLESKEGKWIKIHFVDGVSLTGKLRCIGVDYLEIESYSKTKDEKKNSYRYQEPENEYGRHLIPTSLVKYITIDANSFLEEEKQYLYYLSLKSTNEEDSDNQIPDIEK